MELFVSAINHYTLNVYIDDNFNGIRELRIIIDCNNNNCFYQKIVYNEETDMYELNSISRFLPSITSDNEIHISQTDIMHAILPYKIP